MRRCMPSPICMPQPTPTSIVCLRPAACHVPTQPVPPAAATKCPNPLSPFLTPSLTPTHPLSAACADPLCKQCTATRCLRCYDSWYEPESEGEYPNYAVYMDKSGTCQK